MNNNTTVEITEIPQAKKERGAFFLRRIQQRLSSSSSSYLFFCFLVPVILTYLVYLAMEIHPFGDGSVLVLDLNAQYVYFFEALRNFVYGEADMLYTFSRALGGEFIGIYAYYVASPLSFIVALFPEGHMLEALLTLFLLKSGLCGLTLGFYLHKNSKNPNKVIIIALSAMYALSAYGIVHQHNTMWIDAMMWLPLLTYGIEQLVKFGKFKLFVIMLALTIWSNFYIGYMVCIYVALYFFYYFIAYGDGRNNPRGEKAHFLRSFIRIVFFSAIAVAMAAFIILGAYYALSFGKNDFTSPDWTPKMKYEFLDLFTKFLPGSYDTVRPEGLPFIYTGLLTLFLVPVYFVSKKVRVREKVGAGVILGFFALSMCVTTLDLIWHGFQNPNWLNTRYSFMFCFLLIVFAYKGFGNIRQISAKFLLAVFSFLVLFVAVCQKQEFETYVKTDSKLLAMETVFLSLLAASIIFTLLCLIIKNKKVRSRESLAGILAAIVCIEIFCSALTCVTKFDSDVVYSGYNGYTSFLERQREISDKVFEGDKSFYRMEKTEIRAVNDNMALGNKGVSNSTSTLNADTIEFLQKMGLCSHSHWSQYTGYSPVSNSFLGIKYIVDSKTSATAPLYYTEAYSTEDLIAYRNDYALSLAFGVDAGIKNFDMDFTESHFKRLNKLMATASGLDGVEIFAPIDIDSTETENCETTSHSGHYRYSPETDTEATVTFKVTSPVDGEIFFFAPSEYKREASFSVNGTPMGSYFGNDSDRMISLGVYEVGEEIEVELTIDGDELYLLKHVDYFCYIDTEAYEAVFSKLLAGPQYAIDEGFKDSHLTGKITTENQAQTILTTIPYDEGWNIYLDGEKVEIYETLDALIAFDIPEAGEHTLEMRYMPKLYVIGYTLSIMGTAVFLVLCVIELVWKKLFRRLLKLEGANADDIYWTLDDFDIDTEEERALPPPENESIIKKAKALLAKITQKKAVPAEDTAEAEAAEKPTEDTSEEDKTDGNATESESEDNGGI
ncbi:MAG: hypothetical protein E7641_00530 [Ruminococcaceae bacterium]|nr:hypothetical protein [Oscillospiraceae bacterium]